MIFFTLKALKKRDAKAAETEELMKSKLEKYESEKKRVSLNFIFLFKCMLYVVVYAFSERESSRIKLFHL